jgi:hypothetical protein
MTLSQRPLRAPAVLLAAVSCLAIVACGGSSGSTGSATNANANANGATGAGGPGGPGAGRFAALRQCLQKNGITLPQRAGSARPRTPGAGVFGGGGGGGGGLGGAQRRLPAGVTQQQFQAALAKCGGAAGFRPRRLSDPAYRQSLVAFAACMRKGGVNLPAPNTSGTGPIFNTSAINQADPKFKATVAKCQPLIRRPAGAPGPGGGPGGPAAGGATGQ